MWAGVLRLFRTRFPSANTRRTLYMPSGNGVGHDKCITAWKSHCSLPHNNWRTLGEGTFSALRPVIYRPRGGRRHRCWMYFFGALTHFPWSIGFLRIDYLCNGFRGIERPDSFPSRHRINAAEFAASNPQAWFVIRVRGESRYIKFRVVCMIVLIAYGYNWSFNSRPDSCNSTTSKR